MARPNRITEPDKELLDDAYIQEWTIRLDPDRMTTSQMWDVVREFWNCVCAQNRWAISRSGHIAHELMKKRYPNRFEWWGSNALPSHIQEFMRLMRKELQEQMLRQRAAQGF